jgi:hypothetical protein
MPAGGIIEWRRGHFRRRGPEVRFDFRVIEETWVGVDGTMRDRMIVTDAHFASAAGRMQWATYGRPVPNFNHVWLGWMSHDGITVGGDRFPPQPWFRSLGEWTGPAGKDVGDSLFTYRQLLSLPTGPAALRGRLQAAERQLEARGANMVGREITGTRTGAFAELNDIAALLTSPVPAADRLALVHAAVTMPGAMVTKHARDSIGRPGIAVSASAGLAFERLVFDPRSGALLEGAPGVAVVVQGSVHSAYALGKGIRPISSPGAPPPAQTPTISQSVGSPTTVFKLILPAPTRPRSQRAPALDWLLIGTPGLRCFAGFASQPTPLVSSHSVERGGRLTHIYRLAPSMVRRRNWCRGRYEISVAPDYARHLQAFQRSERLTAGSGSSVFFQVR